MRELIDPRAVERMLAFLAVGGPLAGLMFGALLGAHEAHSGRRVVAGTLIGALGTVVWGMWHVYGAITDKLGLDSLANLGLQLVLFAATGAAVGVCIARISLLLKRL